MYQGEGIQHIGRRNNETTAAKLGTSSMTADRAVRESNSSPMSELREWI